jgi:hypothetical protein
MDYYRPKRVVLRPALNFLLHSDRDSLHFIGRDLIPCSVVERTRLLQSPSCYQGSLVYQPLETTAIALEKLVLN